MSKTNQRLNIDEIAKTLLKNAEGVERSPQQARLLKKALQLLAQGKPVSPQQVEQIAAEVDLTADEAQATLRGISERSDEGDNIVGLSGLSLNNWSHKFKINGQTLSTWCAFDTLFLPQLLKQTAEVRSPDPVTEEIVRLTIGPEIVEQISPAGAVISIVIPHIEKKRLTSAEQIWAAFCNYSHYFTALKSAHDWFQGKHIEPIILSIEEGHQLGQKWLERFGHQA